MWALHKPGGDGGATRPSDPSQEAAQLARALIPDAMSVVASILKSASNPKAKLPRNGKLLLDAVRLTLETAGDLKPQTIAAPVISLADAQAASAELKRRKQQG